RGRRPRSAGTPRRRRLGRQGPGRRAGRVCQVSAGGLDVEAFLDRLRGIATEWESAHDQLETLRISTTSRDRLATATADSGGSVVDLVLAPGLRRHGSEVVAASILEATSAAVEQANTRR